MRGDRFIRVVRAWLLPLRRLEDAAGWVQLVWVLIAFILAPSVIAAIAEHVSPKGWDISWLLLAVAVALLLLALFALWRLTPNRALRVELGPVQTPEAFDPATGQKVADARWFHARVHSDTVAANCRGRIIQIDQENVTGEWIAVPGYKPPYPLTLDSEDGEAWPYDIEDGLPARINLVLSQSNQPGIALLCVPRHGPHGNPTHLAPGKYRLTVRYTADGVAAVDARFVVRVTSLWSGLDVGQDD